jgi:hypothetical protein
MVIGGTWTYGEELLLARICRRYAMESRCATIRPRLETWAQDYAVQIDRGEDRISYWTYVLYSTIQRSTHLHLAYYTIAT